MHIREESEWPKTPDGATDWEFLFEDKKTGWMTGIEASDTPEQLKQRSQDVIKAVFNRKEDPALVEKISNYLEKIIPDTADHHRLPTMKAGTCQLMRKLKENRIHKAEHFSEKTVARVNTRKPKQQKDRRTHPVSAFLQRHIIKIVVTLVVIIPLGIYLGLSWQRAPKGDVREHIQWVESHIRNNLPNPHWELQSVKQSKEGEIAVDILLRHTEHIKVIKSMKRIARVAVLKQVCPNDDSGIKDILDQGWHLWINIRSEVELLTGGTCHY